MLFNIESLSHTLSTRFEPLYTNMYHIDLSDGAVSCYVPRLEIYGAIYVNLREYIAVLVKIFKIEKFLKKFSIKLNVIKIW